MTEATPFPLDFDALNRGDIIPAERIEEIYAVSRTHTNFRFAAMNLAESIEAHFRTVKADELIVKHDGDSLRLLTHPEQSIEAQRRAASMVRGFGRALMKAAAVDQGMLDSHDRDRHARFVAVTAFRYQQLRKAPPPELTNGAQP
ncbi:MAG: hypothetical protein WAT39_23845 [Planctomycetota bacterium]